MKVTRSLLQFLHTLFMVIFVCLWDVFTSNFQQLHGLYKATKVIKVPAIFFKSLHFPILIPCTTYLHLTNKHCIVPQATSTFYVERLPFTQIISDAGNPRSQEKICIWKRNFYILFSVQTAILYLPALCRILKKFCNVPRYLQCTLFVESLCWYFVFKDTATAR